MMVYEYGNPNAEIVLIQPVDAHDLSIIENEINEIRRLSKTDFFFLVIKIERWNEQLSPWKAPAVFGKEDFGDDAKDTLKEILNICKDDNKKYIIGGYSLAALFSLWAAYQTNAFYAVAAASPSIWFPRFIEYMGNHEIMTKKIYLSLGDKEEKSKNPIMASVGECIRRAKDIFDDNVNFLSNLRLR